MIGKGFVDSFFAPNWSGKGTSVGTPHKWLLTEEVAIPIHTTYGVYMCLATLLWCCTREQKNQISLDFQEFQLYSMDSIGCSVHVKRHLCAAAHYAIGRGILAQEPNIHFGVQSLHW